MEARPHAIFTREFLQFSMCSSVIELSWSFPIITYIYILIDNSKRQTECVVLWLASTQFFGIGSEKFEKSTLLLGDLSWKSLYASLRLHSTF